MLLILTLFSVWLLIAIQAAAQVAPKSISLQVQAGYSIIANQFNRGGNQLNDVIPVAADGTTIFKWNSITQSYDPSTYDALSGEWWPNTTLAPGDGAWIFSPASQAITFTGQSPAPPGPQTRPLTAELRLRSARTADTNTFEQMMGFPPAEGDKVLRYDGTFSALPSQPTSVHVFSNDVWSPSEPLVAPGKAVFVQLAAQVPPTIVQQPQSQTVNEGSMAFFSVGSGGTSPLKHQWCKNGIPIPGATASYFGITNATLSDAGTYSVVISNPIGSVTSSNAILTVNSRDCLSLVCPSNIVIAGHSPTGTKVYYKVEATNRCSPSDLVVQCSPPSGSLFPPGVTTVTCKAQGGGKTVESSFTVSVLGTGPLPPSCLGKIVDKSGRPLVGVPVVLTGVANQTVHTDAAGYYWFRNLSPNESYTIQPSKEHFKFEPAQHQFGGSFGQTSVDFVGETPFQAWQLANWGTNSEWKIIGPNADPDQDGMPNLLEYAFGYDPKVAKMEKPVAIEYVRSNNIPHVRLELKPAAYATDVAFALERTINLENSVWATLPGTSLITIGKCPPSVCPIIVSHPVINPLEFIRVRVIPTEPVDEPIGRATAPLLDPAVGESLRLGFYNVQMLHPVALAFTETSSESIPDRPRRIAHRIQDTGFDVIALSEAFRNGENPCGIFSLPGGEEVKAFFSIVAGEEIATLIEAAADGVEAACSFVYETFFPNARDDAKSAFVQALSDPAVPDRDRYDYFVKFLDANGFSFDDSGLMLFSKLPFVRLPDTARPYLPDPSALEASADGVALDAEQQFVAFTRFEERAGWDKFAAKGAGLVRLRNPNTGTGPNEQRHYTLVFTHLNADNEPEIRRSQLQQISEMVQAILSGLEPAERAREHVFLLGDMNINGDLTQLLDDAGVVTPELAEWHEHFNRPGSFFMDTLRDAWAQQCNTSVTELPYLDPGRTADLNHDVKRRFDYFLANTPPEPFMGRPLAVQHMALAYGLRDPASRIRAAFGFDGDQDLSDHYGIIVDLNLQEEGCNPQTAHFGNARPEDLDGTPNPGELKNPGSMQWYRFDQNGTYTFAHKGDSDSGSSSNDFIVDVFRSSDLSRPMTPYLDHPRMLLDSAGQPVAGLVYASGREPLFVRVTPKHRSGHGKYVLLVRRHDGVSAADAIQLKPNEASVQVNPLPDGRGRDPRWFGIRTERTTSGRSQHINIKKEDTAGLHHKLELFYQVDAPADPNSSGEFALELPEANSTREGVGTLDWVLTPALAGGGRSEGEEVWVYYLKASSFPDTEVAAYSMKWNTDLTVLFGSGGDFQFKLQADRTTDIWCDPIFGICLNTHDDDVKLLPRLEWVTSLGLTETLSLPLMTGGEAPLRSELAAGEPVGLNGRMPIIRFLPDERVIIALDEDDLDVRLPDGTDVDVNENDILEGIISFLPAATEGNAPFVVEVKEVRDGVDGRYRFWCVRSHSSAWLPHNRAD